MISLRTKATLSHAKTTIEFLCTFFTQMAMKFKITLSTRFWTNGCLKKYFDPQKTDEK
jgi:hypothetical protein